ncbi:GNAT family N-acetyltransferase [Acinetobacter sp. SM34]|uniref:GNAT family N-acetyltransferase n=1 Tax=Acinetobacter sp. SM34 TaxID=1301620 RepID=UPI001EDC4AF9|nr:GNAT family N-acetyltransferase [Acinetobacter sp. SM34]MCG2609549.1 GNAT family N-acetyltransferase [Acinetobacter sp. SM34]
MKIEVLQAHHQKKSFNCGQDDLNKFIKQYASQHQKSGTSKTYVAIDDDIQVKGFYCLSSISIGFDVVDTVLTKRLPRYPLPCVVVGRFAVDQTVQGRGMGKVLLAHALKQVLKVAQIIGVNFVVIHAKDQKAMEFYQRFGFISLTTNPLTLIYPVSEIPNFN